MSCLSCFDDNVSLIYRKINRTCIGSATLVHRSKCKYYSRLITSLHDNFTYVKKRDIKSEGNGLSCKTIHSGCNIGSNITHI